MIREEIMSSQKFCMGASLVSILLVGLILSAAAANGSLTNNDLGVAIEEMKSGHYFAFVMLIKMLNDSIPCNITFLMPNDRMLSNVSMPGKAVSEFLMRHSIPMPLLFEYIEHFPPGSIIPTNEPGFNLTISRSGRRKVRLNNARIVHPDLCTAGSSIRCHGIDAVLSAPEPGKKLTAHSPSCGTAFPPHPAPVPVTPTEPPTPPPPPKSESSRKLNAGLLGIITACLILLVVESRI